MSVYPLINPRDVFQSAMGAFDTERPLGSQTLGPCKACVTQVYPVGHPANPSGQVLVDVEPSRGLPILYRVPLAYQGAHEETDPAAPLSRRRNPFAPKPKNRMQGAALDVRPGTFVVVNFLGGSVFNPVVTATLGFNQAPDRLGAAQTPSIDRIAPDGTVATEQRRPLDSGMDDYPRHVASYNGARTEVDNRGNTYIQTSNDQAPVWNGGNQIAKSPDPEGNYGVSSRGAKVGNIRFTTGKGDDGNGHAGRQERVSMGADDGTIRDETDGGKGAIIHRARGGPVWTRGGYVYEEGGGAYMHLDGDVDLHGGTAVLNAGTVKLGGPGMSDQVVLWPQLCQVLAAIFTIFDTHKHAYIPGSSGTANTSIPDSLQTPDFNSSKEAFKAADVFAGPSASPSAKRKDDPDGGRDGGVK